MPLGPAQPSVSRANRRLQRRETCAALDEEEAGLDGFRIGVPPLAAFSGSRQCLHRRTRGWRRFGLAVLQ
ncbi:hypothetical protein TNCT6_77910 [Streptomyces sp. 6-11-2]|nr:hypothetical protein TNCT6_77910 [Streptomyces sp. 6-11-2]